MSTISVAFSYVSMYARWSSAPVAAASSPSTVPATPKAVEHDHDEHQRPRENTLVKAMMAAFQALGLGPAASSSASASAPAAPAVPADVNTAPSASSPTPTASAAPSNTDLETAVRDFAHALYAALHDSGRGHQGPPANPANQGEQGTGQTSHHRGYNSFVQRLERLVQSLTPTPAPAGSEAAATTPTAASSSPAADATAPVATPPRGVSRLLSSFTKLLSVLQPAGSPAAPTPASADSASQKLQQFLQAMVQALQANHADTAPASTGNLLQASA